MGKQATRKSFFFYEIRDKIRDRHFFRCMIDMQVEDSDGCRVVVFRFSSVHKRMNVGERLRMFGFRVKNERVFGLLVRAFRT